MSLIHPQRLQSQPWFACLLLACCLSLSCGRVSAETLDDVWRLMPYADDRFALLVTRSADPVSDGSVAMTLRLDTPALEGWRVAASGQRLPVRGRSVVLVDLDPAPERHRYGSRLHQVRSLGVETDLSERWELRLDWNRYFLLGDDFDVLAIGFSMRLR